MVRTGRRRYSEEERAERAREESAVYDEASRTLAGDPNVIKERIRDAATGGMSPRILGYSLRNQMMLMDQAAARGIPLRDVDTFRGWKTRGRSVRKGERGLRIIRPMGLDDDAKGNEDHENDEPTSEDTSRVRFAGMVVFEVSQTDPIEGAEQDTDRDCSGCDAGHGDPCHTGCTCPVCTGTGAQSDEPPGHVLWNNLYEQITRAGYAFDWPADTGADLVTVDHDGHTVHVALSATPDNPDALADIAAALARIIARADQRRAQKAQRPQLTGPRPALTAGPPHRP